MEGIRITPALIEKAKAAKSVKELMELCKGEGLELDEKSAEELFAKLNSASAEDLASVKGGSCFEDKCPKCGSNNISKHVISISLTDETLECHCNHCGYTWIIG